MYTSCRIFPVKICNLNENVIFTYFKSSNIDSQLELGVAMIIRDAKGSCLGPPTFTRKKYRSKKFGVSDPFSGFFIHVLT